MENVLTAFGFDPHWIQWVSNLISMTFFSILLNGARSPPFNPTWGIRQGDPLSPFLVIVMSKGLGRMISQAKLQGSLRGLEIHNHSPITDQQFVDDNILMGHPSIHGPQSLKDTFRT